MRLALIPLALLTCSLLNASPTTTCGMEDDPVTTGALNCTNPNTLVCEIHIKNLACLESGTDKPIAIYPTQTVIWIGDYDKKQGKDCKVSDPQCPKMTMTGFKRLPAGGACKLQATKDAFGSGTVGVAPRHIVMGTVNASVEETSCFKHQIDFGTSQIDPHLIIGSGADFAKWYDSPPTTLFSADFATDSHDDKQKSKNKKKKKK